MTKKFLLLVIFCMPSIAIADCVGSDGAYYTLLANDDLAGSNGKYLIYQAATGNYSDTDGVFYQKDANGNLIGNNGVFLSCRWN